FRECRGSGPEVGQSGGIGGRQAGEQESGQQPSQNPDGSLYSPCPAQNSHVRQLEQINTAAVADVRGPLHILAAMAWYIVIVGGELVRASFARLLEKALPRQSARLTLVKVVNFLLYTALLPEAADGTLDNRHVLAPL